MWYSGIYSISEVRSLNYTIGESIINIGLIYTILKYSGLGGKLLQVNT